MANKRYYTFPSVDYTDTAFAVTNTTLTFILNALYSDEIARTSFYDVFKNRMFVADTQAGTDIAVGDIFEQVAKINKNFPVTVYNIGEMETNPALYSYPAQAGIYADSDLKAKVKTWPVTLQIFFTTIFTTPHDYMRAHQMLRNNVQNTLTRLAVPVMINGKTHTFPADLTIEIVKGEYPFEREKQREKMEIYDLNHICTLSFYETAFDYENVHFVKDITFYIESFTGSNDINKTVLVDSITSISVPYVSSTVPVNGSITHAVTDPIVINFSEPVRPESFFYDIVPYINTVKTWDALDQSVTIRPYGANWTAATLYNVSISNQLLNGQGSWMQDDYSFVFTTV